jgi:hypothetical protein
LLNSKKDSLKNHKKNLAKMVGFRLTSCPKYWHFGQVEHGDIWGTFWSNLLVKKTMFFLQ